MAINPELQYPGKINPSDADYPFGSARNITVPGDGTGTPWEAAIVNDLLGWQQELLTKAGVVPSGNPDKVGASQYYDSLVNIAGREYDTVANMKADEDLLPGQVVRTYSYSASWTATAEPEGGAAYSIATLQQVRDAKGDGGWVPDELGDHTIAGGNGYVAVLLRGSRILSGAYGPTTAGLNAALGAGSVDLSRDYILTDNLEMTVADSELVGNGFTLDCTGTAGSNAAGQGGGVLVSAAGVTIRGLKLVGNIEPVDSVNFTGGRLIRLAAGQATVKDCLFVGSNGGGVSVVSDNNIIQSNRFDRVNNRGGGGDYGSVDVSAGKRNKILDNIMEGQFYAGISLHNPNVTETLVQGNYIEPDLVTFTYSMGIFVLDGASTNLTIADNQIINNGNEGIVVFSRTSNPTKGLIIKGNLIRNSRFAGIFINQHPTDQEPTTNAIIADNIIQPVTGVNYTGLGHIVLEQLVDSVVTGNTILGTAVGRGSATEGVGILVQQAGCLNNVISSNNVSHVATGINLVGLRSICSNNHTSECDKGIFYDSCDSSSIINNSVIDCTVGLDGNTSFFPYLAMNTMIECTKTNTVNRQLYGHYQREGNEGQTRDYANGTLVAGTANVTFFHIKAGDMFVALPDDSSGTNTGALYVDNISAASNTLRVQSTNASDTRNFTVLRLINGVDP